MLIAFLLTALALQFQPSWTWKNYEHDNSFTPDAILRVTAENVTNGCINRQTALVNQSSPGLELRFKHGKVVWIRVWNDMSDANLTMHWHGLTQASAPFADGTPQASQWPIPPNHFFDYELDLRRVTVGSYFYHSHVGFQAASATGPLIVEDAHNCPYKYDDERTLFLTDVFNKTDGQIETGLVASPFVWSGESNALLVNGFGITETSTITTGAGCGLAQIDVRPDTHYRLRFISATALSLVPLAIEGHSNLSIIEADGDYTQPYSVDFLQLGSGQRYSVLLKTKSCDELKKDGKSEYYIQLETRERPTLTRGFAILKYSGKCIPSGSTLPTDKVPSQSPLQLPKTQLAWLEYALRPLHKNDFPSASEVTRRVTINVQQIVNSHTTWQENMYSWFGHPVPYLVALYQNATQFLPDYDYALQNEGIDNRTGAFPAKIGEVLEIIWQNEGATNGGLDAHPMHAHGAHYYDIGSGNGTYDAEANEKLLAKSKPVRRDSTMLYRYGNSTTPGGKSGWRGWRLRVTEPGVWMLHCHTLQHMIMGMQTAWVFGDAADVLKLPKPQVEGYLAYGSNVYGNSTHNPRMPHWTEN